MRAVRVPRRAAVAGGAVVAALAVAAGVTVAVSGGAETIADAGDPIAAARTADRVPRGPYVRNIPFDCGMTPPVITRLTSYDKTEDAETGGVRCTWSYSGVDVWGYGSSGRSLEVEVETGQDGETTSTSGDAAREMDRTIDTARDDSTVKTGPVTTLTGLGGAAVAWTDLREASRPPAKRKPGRWYGTSGTTVVFQAGNALVRVAYTGADHSSDGIDPAKDPHPDATMLNGALTAATRVARSLHAPVNGTPRVAPEPPGAPVPPVRDACALVPSGVVRTALGRAPAEHSAEESYLYHGEGTDDVAGVESGACSWSATLGPNVDIDAVTVGDGATTGAPRTVAAREFRRLYLDGRDAPVRGNRFSALRDLGDEAFAYYRPDEVIDDAGEGVVAVRIGNALLRARCWSTEGYPLDEAVNCAYRSARAAAEKVGR